MDYDHDIVIVGGGPAGTTLALYAARAGLDTLLLEREHSPRDKVCGDAIPPACLAMLGELGLVEELLSRPHARADITWHLKDQRLHLRGVQTLLCKRWHFDQVLLQAARSKCTVREGHRVIDLLCSGSRIVGVKAVSDRGRHLEFTAKVVVGADGYRSILTSRLGLPQCTQQPGAAATRAYYQGKIDAECAMEFYFFPECTPGYMWLFPVGDGIVNVGVLQFSDRRRATSVLPRSLHARLVRRLEQRLGNARQMGKVRVWPLPIADHRRVVHGHGFLLVGDAAGLIDPFMGHGIDAAMDSGRIAARVLAQACRSTDCGPAALQTYADELESRYGAYFARRASLRQNFARCHGTDQVEFLRALFPGSETAGAYCT